MASRLAKMFGASPHPPPPPTSIPPSRSPSAASHTTRERSTPPCVSGGALPEGVGGTARKEEVQKGDGCGGSTDGLREQGVGEGAEGLVGGQVEGSPDVLAGYSDTLIAREVRMWNSLRGQRQRQRQGQGQRQRQRRRQRRR